ncbi:MAG: class I SAM-dependent methyltransferase [Fimbriimonadaceae bacterium]|nr:class I SAM-dependent methyltransferase [Alphaproteobacteria bacterium]
MRAKSDIKPIDSLASIHRQVPTGYNRGMRVPWRLKMAFRLTMSRLPLPRIFTRLLPVHGETNLDRLIVLFETKLLLYQSLAGHRPRTYLELGPGDSIARALVAASHGINRTWLIDAGNFARRDLAYYHDIAASLTTRGLSVPNLSKCRNMEDVLTACGASYLIGGLSSLQQIEDNSIDLIISEAVLEHLPRHEFTGFMAEFQRILSPGAIALHGVDLDDHLDGGLNHLRFSRDSWERQAIRHSGFYTNRLSRSEIHQSARRAGMLVGEYYRLEWRDPPIEKNELHLDLRRWRKDDLLVRSFGLALQENKKS